MPKQPKPSPTLRKTYRRDPNRPENVGNVDRDSPRVRRKNMQAGAPEYDAAMRQGIAMSADGHQLQMLRRRRRMGPGGIAGS